MADAMLHPEFETLSPAALKQLQEELWADQWPYVSNSDFYRAKLGARAGPTSG